MRITETVVDDMSDAVNRQARIAVTLAGKTPTEQVVVERNASGYRVFLVSPTGSRPVSDRGTSREAYVYLDGMLRALDLVIYGEAK